jgi:hypothetical protein
MDKIIRITLGLVIIILVAFTASVMYTRFVDNAYRTSFSSTYSYHCTIITDNLLTNMTLFVPVPASPAGTSPIIDQISAHNMTGFPEDWNAVLFDTGKSTLLEIAAAKIGQPPVNGSAVTTNVTFVVNAVSSSHIDTQSTMADDAIFRPVQDAMDTACPVGVGAANGLPHCVHYVTGVFAKYGAAPAASVSIHASVTGRNSWLVFHPEFNEFQNTLDVTLSGSNNGWVTALGWLENGIGSYDEPLASH